MDDICELADSSELSRIKNFRKRYEENKIYTYASQLLVVINPFCNVSELYGRNQMKRYQGKNKECPHIYAIANEALTNVENMPQTIVISGISGSGKNESSKHVIEYLCNSDGGKFDKSIIRNATPILEAFGNAKTTHNKNSSRFCNLVELHYDAGSKLVGARVHYHLLEVTRVCAQNPHESNFNVFYSLLFDAPTGLKEEMWLNEEYHKYLPDLRKHSQKCNINFNMIDNSLTIFRLDPEKKHRIYRIVSAILCLGDIKFKNVDGCAQITNDSVAAFDHAAQLLSLDSEVLRTNLLAREIFVNGSNITIPLSRESAEKSRDNFAKRLYGLLFKRIVDVINKVTDFQSTNAFIGILDIAGFECLEDNTFDQLCINYINERVQQFFIRYTILEEKHWYEKEGVQLPFIPFFDNSPIVEIFDHTSRGILTLLNDECILPNSSINNFMDKFRSNWNGHKALVQSTNTLKSSVNSFTIHHFSDDVTYCPAEFIEKNYNTIALSMEKLAVKAMECVGTEKPEYEPLMKKSNFSSISLNLKKDVNALIAKLTQTTPRFIRCVKANAEMMPKSFDECMVLQQLKSASTLSYADFVCFRFPLRITLKRIKELYASYYEICAGPNQFHMKLLLSIGLRIGEFKLGSSHILFRSNKHDKTQQLLSVESSISKLKRYKARMRWLILFFFFVKCIKEKNSAKQSAASTNNIYSSVQQCTSLPCNGKKIISIGEQSTPQIVTATEIKRKVVLKKEKPSTRRAKTENKPLNDLRYNGINHWAEIDGNRNASRCKGERCNQKTHCFCTECKVHLCLTKNRNCFKNFHVLNIKKPSETF